MKVSNKKAFLTQLLVLGQIHCLRKFSVLYLIFVFNLLSATANNPYTMLLINKPQLNEVYTDNLLVDFTAVGNNYINYTLIKDGIALFSPRLLYFSTVDGRHSINLSLNGLESGTYQIRLYSNNVVTSPVFHINESRNYVKKLIANKEISDNLLNHTKEEVSQTIVYFDGLGRQQQSVDVAASPNGKDIITVVTYDAFGRPDKNYLPYEQNSASTGAYRTDWLTEIDAFYDATTSNAVVNEDTYYYSQGVYESSPLNRVIKSMAPGSAWVGSARGIASEYEANSVADNIFEFDVENTSGRIQVLSDFHYPAGSLYKYTTTDEDGHIIEEYKDKLGQVVAKKAFLSQSESADTYYLYDDFGQLRYVIQPEGIKALKVLNTLALVESMVNEMSFRDDWMFQYQYDARKRMIVKKVPGAEPVYMVYDARDRLVLTQDGNQRGVDVKNIGNTAYQTDHYEWTNYEIGNTGSVTLKPGFVFTPNAYRELYIGSNAETPSGRWTYCKYDALNRPVITGSCTSASKSLADIRSEAMSNSGYETRAEGTPDGYTTTGTYPPGNSADFVFEDVLMVNYYDDYSFMGKSYFTYGRYSTVFNTSYVNAGAAFEASASSKVRGRATGSKSKILGTCTTGICTDQLVGVTYYDDKGQVIQTVNVNAMMGTDRVSNAYNFTGQVTKSIRNHTAEEQNDLKITDDFVYDHAGRLQSNTTTLERNGTATTSSTVQHQYDELGRLKEKNMGTVSTDYAYNIRGWMTKINGGATTFDDGSDIFGMELEYESAGLYNGNIGAISWKNTYNGGQAAIATGIQRYSYTYDKLNRLKRADYLYNGSATGEYTVDTEGSGNGIVYDLNGNIKSLRRRGVTSAGTNGILHNFTYAYNGNQLTGLTNDETNESSSEGTWEYAYDANGNLLSDDRKQITSIKYNHLNLPEEVTLAGPVPGTVYYLYSADGVKLRKRFDKVSGIDEVTEYVGGVEYINETLSRIATPEGYARMGSGFIFYYNITDHLGNVRATIQDNGTVIQRDDYYPFGLTFNSYKFGTENNYLYNQGTGDKTFDTERQQELQIDLTKFRTYDYALGRFMQVDPLADVNPQESWTPYQFAYNNPVMYSDPYGDCPMCIGAFIGAIGGAIAGVIMGKSGQEILAMAAGGAVAGATLGLGTVAVGALGGVATIGGAGSAYVVGASGIVGGMLGSVAEQGVKMGLGVQESFSGDQVVLSGAVGIIDAALGGVGDVVTEPVKNGLKGFVSSQVKKSTSAQAQKQFKTEVAKTLRYAGAGSRQAKKAANELTEIMVENRITEANVIFTVGEKSVDVTVTSAVSTTTETIKDKVQQ